MKQKLLSLLICTLFLTSLFAGVTTAKNLMRNDTGVAYAPAAVSTNRELIKITQQISDCDIDDDMIVYASSTSLYIYDIQTGDTENVFVGGNIVFPKISERRVVYYDFSYMGFKLYDIETSEKTDLIVTNWQGGDADSFQFYGDYLVYENFDSDMYSTEIFLYTITTGETRQLTDSPGEDYTENPCIYGDRVAWQLWEGNLCDIVLYDISSSEYLRVTNTSQFASETFPSLYGETVAYSYFYYDKINGTMLYGLNLFDITTGVETTVFTAEEPTANSPEMFGDRIVYSVPDGRLSLYDLPSHTESMIYESFYLVQPWNIHEDYVVFTVLDEGVYLYKINTSPPAIEIDDITGGLFKVGAVIRNAGTAEATDIQWSIKLTGGLIVLGKESTGTIPTLAAGSSVDISSTFLLGFGKTVITITADTAVESQNATVLFVFIRLER